MAVVARRCGQGLLIAVTIGVTLWLLGHVLVVVVPVVLAVFLTTLLEPPVRFLREHGVPPALATTSVVLGGIALLAAGVLLLAPVTINSIDDLSGRVGGAVTDIEDFLERRAAIEPDQLARAFAAVREQVAGPGGLTQRAISGVVTLGEVLVGLVLTLVLAVYFVHGGSGLLQGALRLAPERHRAELRRAGQTTWSVVGGYIRGTAIVGLVDAVLIGAGLWLLDVPLVIPLTVLTFLGAFVPLVGAFAVGILSAVVALVDRGPTIALAVVAITFVVQQLEGNILAPRVMAKELDLHPVVVLCAVTTGGTVAGILGAFLAVPLTAVVAGLLRDRTTT